MLHQKDVDEKIKLMVVSESSKDLVLMEEMVRLQISTRKVPSVGHLPWPALSLLPYRTECFTFALEESKFSHCHCRIHLLSKPPLQTHFPSYNQDGSFETTVAAPLTGMPRYF